MMNKRQTKVNKGKSILSKLLATIVLVVLAVVGILATVKKDSIMTLFAGQTIDANATSKVLPYKVVPYVEFNYTGGPQTWTVPETGYYRFEVWGAQGGNYTANDNFGHGTAYGGYGGYATGVIRLDVGTRLNIYVGGKGNGIDTGGYNGGGTGKYSRAYYWTPGESHYRYHYSCAGGGATDIRLEGTGLYNRVIVAGGGGGALARKLDNKWSYYSGSSGGGSGGGGTFGVGYNAVDQNYDINGWYGRWR